jgi:uncharacterized protein with GYD domain
LTLCPAKAKIAGRGAAMPTYLSLVHWTHEGITKVKESPSRLDAAKKAIEASGGKMKQIYMLMGQYDVAILVEAPDDATVARINLALGSKGSVRTETSRAFSEEEYRKIISKLP